MTYKAPWREPQYINLPMPGDDWETETVKVHHLKCEANAFDAVTLGVKTAEFRLNDRAFRPGDIIMLHKLNSRHEVEEYSPTLCGRIMHIYCGGAMPDGYVLICFTTIKIDKSLLRS